MNIDLLFTEEGEAGLIANQNLAKKAIGIIFDPASGIFSMESADMDYMDLNIPVDSFYNQYIDLNEFIHIGSVVNGNIGQAYQVPLLFADDPYRNDYKRGEGPDNALTAFSYFVKNVVAGQPVYRLDLADEKAMGCVLGDASPNSLEFAPHLARQHGLEVKPDIAPINAPGMGLGGSTSGGGYSGGAEQQSGESARRSSNARKDGKDDKKGGGGGLLGR